MRHGLVGGCLAWLAGCNCADPSLRPDASAPVEDASESREASGDPEQDAASVPNDLGPPRVRDAYVARDPAPDPPGGPCEGTASIRLLNVAEGSPTGRGVVQAARWGDGLLLQWDVMSTIERYQVAHVAEPVAGAPEIVLDWVGARALVWLPTSDEGVRAVFPGSFATLSDDGLGPDVALPPAPAELEEPLPLTACEGAEAVLFSGSRTGPTVLAFVSWVDGAPRWSAPVVAPEGLRDVICVAGPDGVHALAWTGGRDVVSIGWERSGAPLPAYVTWEVGEAEDVYVPIALAGRDDAGVPLVIAGSDHPDDLDVGLTVARVGSSAIEPIGSTRVERAPAVGIRVYGATTVSDRLVVVYAAPLIATVTFDLERGVAGPATPIAGHGCGPWGHGVALPSGYYVALECGLREVWLLRVCGGGS
ncbi:MAG: hypothetical protein IT379_02095 [Deltaproteobacteria bacterium]|nr:hypothetical protein [Deltaproteobacteria bacterium]